MVVSDQKIEDSCWVVVKDMCDGGCIIKRRLGQSKMYMSRMRQPLRKWS